MLEKVNGSLLDLKQIGSGVLPARTHAISVKPSGSHCACAPITHDTTLTSSSCVRRLVATHVKMSPEVFMMLVPLRAPSSCCSYITLCRLRTLSGTCGVVTLEQPGDTTCFATLSRITHNLVEHFLIFI